jgi:hypothetical protein
MAIGVGVAVTVLTPLTVGPFVLVAVVVALGVLVRRPAGLDAAVTGLLPGAGLLMVYIAYINRHGPGEVCRTAATEHECTTQWSPWPWLLVGLGLTAVGVWLFRRVGGWR